MVHRFFFLCINVLGDFQLCHISIKAWTCLLKLWTDYIALTPIDLSEKDSMEFYTLAKKKKNDGGLELVSIQKAHHAIGQAIIFLPQRTCKFDDPVGKIRASLVSMIWLGLH